MKSTFHPKDFFLHLLAIITLYVVVVHYVIMLFTYVNIQFPDPLEWNGPGALSGIRQAMAVLFILFPVYIASSWMLRRDILHDKHKAEFWVRRWLISLTLFLAAIAIMVDLVVLVFSFLNGELTFRFLIKVVIILAIASAVFWYYFHDLRGQFDKKSLVPKKAASTASGIVIVSIIAGFFIVGSPMHQRKVRFDDARQWDLQSTQNQIVHYWQQKDALPETLDDLKDSISGFKAPVDPRTEQPYEYIVTGRLTFELCAEFETEREYGSKEAMRFSRNTVEENWDHPAGRYCYERTIDPELHKPQPVLVR